MSRPAGTFAQAFQSHLPPERLACIDVPAIIEHMMIGVGGMHDQRGITINRDHLPPWDVKGTVAHEMLHACTHQAFKSAIQRRGPHMARAIDEGLTEALLERCLPDRNWFSRLLSALGANSGYSHGKLSNGDDWLTAGRKLVDKAGLPVVLDAYLGGNREAIKKVMLAAGETHPPVHGWGRMA
jgi:hypothetical protein